MSKNIVVLGAGTMGAALIGGILKGGVTDRSRLAATTLTPARAAQVASQFGIRVTAGGNREAAAAADVVVLAVMPGALPGVLEEIREVLRPEQILLSLAASVPIALIEQLIGLAMPVFRAMPNIPVVVEEGATAVAANQHCTAAQRDAVGDIFRAVGVVVFVEEDLMHAVAALSSSGPAYVYMFIEAVIAGGLKLGVPREVAAPLAVQTVLGAARMARETGMHPALLRDQVITPGGATISAIHELEKHGLRSMLISAIETAAHRSETRAHAFLARFAKEG